jgi:hypothetical protein
MLVRQKKEAKGMMEGGAESAFWAKFTISAADFLYSTIVTFMTVAGAESYG